MKSTLLPKLLRLMVAKSRLSSIEPLEARIAPATFTGAGATLTINLTNADELVTFSTTGTTITALSNFNAVDGGGTGGNVTGFGTPSVAITSAGFTTINVVDGSTGDGVAFANSTGAYTQTFGITLNDATSGNVTFAGGSTFGASLTASTTNGFIASDAASSLTLTGAANLSLSASGHDILLQGAVAVGGTTSFTADTGVLQADNPANDFAGAVTFTGSAVSLFDVNALTLGAFNVTGIPQVVTSRIAAGGNITQTGAGLSSGTGTLAFSSTGGSLNLNNGGNNLDSNVALSATGANDALIFSLSGLKLGNVTLGTGLLTTIFTAGTLSQAAGTTIETDGALAISVNAGTGSVDLAGALNRIGGAVTLTETGGDFSNVKLRNIAPTATLPTGTPLTTAGDVASLTLIFDNAGMALPGYNVSGSLVMTAGGDITQTAALTAANASSFSVLGDHTINLGNTANAFGNNVGFSAPQSTQPVVFADTGGLALGQVTLGRGAFSATAVTGDITQTLGFTQEKGALPATFTVTAGTSITLADSTNRFTGGLVFAGGGLATLSVRNADFMASFAQLTFPASLSNLTVRFDNASMVLPSLTLGTLNVNAQGIVQQAGSSLNLSGTGIFNANAFALDLSNAGNDFANLNINNSGRNDVKVNDVDDLFFTGTSALGTGRLTVKAGSSIAAAGATITQATGVGPAGEVSFTAVSGNVTLPDANRFLGPVSISVIGAGTVTVMNSGATLTLGDVTTGAGLFTATATPGIVQDFNSVLTLGGASSFTATGNTITLGNSTNTFTGAVALTSEDATLRSAGAIVFAASNVNTNFIVKTGGAATHTITQTGPITGTPTATLDAGAGNITLTDAANNFTQVRLISTGTAVAITDSNGLAIGPSQLGGGTLAITTGGSITSSGSLVQTTGTGAITFSTPAASNITLNNSGNLLRGAVNVVQSNNVNLRSSGDVVFAPGSVVTGDLIATAGGIITLPSDLTQINGLTLSANSTTINSDVVVTGGSIDVTGALTLIGNRSLTTTGSTIVFRNGVTAGGTLTLGVAAGGTVQVQSGDWNQGANDLTITGTGADLRIGGTGAASFNMTSGTISLPGAGDVQVFASSTLRVGSTAAAETVTIANGAGALIFDANAALGVGFGATNDKLVKTGTGAINLTAGALLRGSGLAGASATPVLVSQTALLAGRFAGSEDASGAPHDFFAGSDIVSAQYDFTQLTVKSGGTLAPTGSISGFLPDGDKYTVTSSLGATAGLAVVENLDGSLAAVIRNNTVAGASTLTISTTGGGDGRLPVSGVMIHTPGSVNISAPMADFTGTLGTAGTLTSFVARDLGVGSAFTLTGGGPATGKTALTAHEVGNAAIVLPGALDKFKAVSVASTATIMADKFGSLTTTGDIGGSNSNTPGVPNPGDFLGKITSTTTATGLVLSSAKIAGTVKGTWDLRGSIGTVATGQVDSWTLGTKPSSTARNGGLLTDVKSLSLGNVVTGLAVNATGALGAFTAFEIGGSGNNVTARSFGTVKVTGNAALGLAGNIVSTTFTATGNAAGIALKSLTVAGDLNSSVLNLLDGDASSIAVARMIVNTTINATDINGHGNLKSLSAATWQTNTIAARSIGTFKSVQNLPAGLFGDVDSTDVTLSGNAAGVALKMFDAKGRVTNSTFTIQNGNLTSFKVARDFANSTVSLTDPAFGSLGTIQAGEWSSVVVNAETIGTLASTGAAALAPASPLLRGDIADSTIFAYVEDGTAAAIGKLSAKGGLDTSTVNAEHGIGSLAIGRTVAGSFLVADDAMSGVLAVGRVGTLTAGAWDNSSVSANTLGVVKITGFAQPEVSTASLVFGDVANSTFLAHGATPTKPTGIDSFSVARDVVNSPVVAPFGIKTLTVGGSIDSSRIITDNPTAPASGFLTSFTAGELKTSTVRAGSIGTLKVAGSVPFGLLGNVNFSTIAVNSSATVAGSAQALGTLTVAGDFVDSVLDAPANVGKIDVRGEITRFATSTRVQAGYAAGSKLGSLTAGSFGAAGSSVTTDLVSQSIGTFILKGNAARGFVGTTDRAFIDILGASGGIGLGTFTASGTATDSLFRVSDGDVTSFTVLRMEGSDLLVGFRPVVEGDITAAPTAANWTATNHKIGTFKTTAPFDATDLEDTASFVDSNVIAGILGSITLSGVNPDPITAAKFGVAFRASAASGAGVVKTNGSATALTAPTTDGRFNYLGLAG